jgi:hypothetical protein
MGEALLKARVGETVKVKAPRGTMEFKIIEIVAEESSRPKGSPTRNGAELPTYVVERLRRKPPPDAPVVESSTPVISFGDPSAASVATLGLNPSINEFESDGRKLDGEAQRLETLTSLGVSSLTDAPEAVLKAVVDACNNYFKRNPYRRWFDKLEEILAGIGTSYFDGSACHLDLVQWTTNPVWGELRPPTLQRALLEQDVPFLLDQLRYHSIEVLLLNGDRVIKEFAKAAQVELPEEPGRINNGCRIVVGRGPKDLLVVGWSTNVQSSHGVSNDDRACIARAVADVVRKNRGRK